MNFYKTNRREFLRNTSIVTAGVSLFPSFLNAQTRAAKRPNLLFIFADQFRKASLGYLKEDPTHTPNLDKLASNGVVFSRAIANHPLCSPYRAMLMSGQYPLKNGVLANCHSGRTAYGNYLKKETICFSDVLARSGYNAGYVGKWHLDGPCPTKAGEKEIWDSWCPPDHRHGFSFWYAYGSHNLHNQPYYWTTGASEEQKTKVDQWSPEHEAEIIMDYLENVDGKHREAEKPFAIFWGINPPHTPFTEVPERYKKQYEGGKYQDLLNRQNVDYHENKELRDLGVGDAGVEQEIHEAPDYFASVTGVDDQIGRVIEKLKEKSLYENTIVVFSSDHGEMLGSHGLMHKNIWYSEALEIPLIVNWPAQLKPRTDDLLISVPDYMPTFLGLMGLNQHLPDSVEGKDYSGVFYNKKVERPDCQLYFGSEPEAPQSGKRGIRTEKYTYVEVKDKKEKKHYFLYDDINDRFQMKNIYGEDSRRDQQLSSRLYKLLETMNDPWLQ